MKKQVYSLSIFLIVSLASCLVATHYTSQQIPAEEQAAQISQRLVDQLEIITKEAEKIQAVVDAKELWGDFSAHNFYWIRNDTVVRWTNHHFVPPISVAKDSFSIRFIRTGSGDFLLKKWQVDQASYLVAGIPLRIHYKISNQYLKPHVNESIFDEENVIILEPISGKGYPITIEGAVVFRVVFSSKTQPQSLWLTIQYVAALVSFLILCVFIFRLVITAGKRSAERGFAVLLLTTVMMRLLMVFFVTKVAEVDSPLFDPQYFASSEINPSMGDLFFNVLVILFLCYYLFKNYNRFPIFQKPIRIVYLRWVLSISSSLLILFGILFPFVVIQTIYNNSSITFSIAQSIHFDTLRVVAFLTVIISWISSWLFVHIFTRLLTYGHSLIRFVFSLLIGIIAFSAINEFTGQAYYSSLLIALIYLLIVLLFRFHRATAKFQYTTFVYFFVAGVCFAANSFFAVKHFEQKERTRNQFRFANDFLIDHDYFGEYLLSEALIKIRLDGFIQGRMASPLLGKEPVRQKIRQFFLPVYFNKYNVDILLFNTAGYAIDNGVEANLAALISHYDREASQTGYQGVYYIAGIQGEVAQQYLAVTSIHRNGILVGYAVMQLSLKRIIPDNVYPELLVDTRFQQLYKSQQFSYAVYQNGAIQLSSGEFNYDLFKDEHFANGELYTKGIEDSGFVHIAAEDAVGKTAVVSSPNVTEFLQLADFSFLVILGISVVLLFLFVLGISTFIWSRDLFLAARIQVFLNLAFFLPLIAVSVITLGLTARSSIEQLNEDYLNKSKSFSVQLDSFFGKRDAENQLETNFSDLVKLANIDANLFSPDGRLLISSQPMIFENQLLAPLMKSSALHRVHQGDKNFVSAESVGSLDYYVAYSALNSSETGELLAIVALPFFQSGILSEKMQISVLANILVIFTLLFILLLLISFFVSKWLTFPLRLITKTLGKISLLKTNQPLEWKSDDEIGLMVREYNLMLTKLSESKIELERTQRERAWREIAQQVAHEIKNPLTPMKLTLQQLDRTLLKGNDNLEKIKKSVGSLLSQIDTLDGIASSFSAFAKMPEPVMGYVDLVKLINGLEHFHSESGNVTFNTSLSGAIVMADEQLLSRILSNVILNGLQSVPTNRIPSLQVSLCKIEGYFQTSIQDNGSGIEEALMDKIFLPHFTTKESGSGLGLAIAKQGIEQMNGKIWFNSDRQGTIFYIELPVFQPLL